MRVSRPLLSAVVAVVLLAVPGQANAQSGNSLNPESIPPPSKTVPPPGFDLSARQAARVARGTKVVRQERARHGGLREEVVIPGYVGDGRRWQVTYSAGRDQVAEVHVDGRTGRVLEVWTGPQVSFPLARGYKPSVGNAINRPYVWLPLALLLLAPFVDPRRPLRLIHLDLLVLLGFGISQLYFNKGQIDLSVPLVYPFLVYLFVRLLLAGLRPRERSGPLIPLVPVAWLAVGLILLVGFRVALNVVDSNVIDVGYASVVGADRITHGQELYTDNDVHGDAYGPVTYLAYVPFEAVLPWSGEWDSVPAAHAAAITFDLLTLLGLFLLGGRLRDGPEGRRLGLALAYAWAAYPYTLYALQENTNDGLVAMLLVFALLALRSAPGRGALIGLGAVTKFVSLAVAPLFAAGTGDRGPSTLLRYAGVFVAVIAVAVIAYLPDGGLREFWNTTLGYQLGRESPFSIWGLHGSLGWLQDVVKAGVVALAAAVAFVPRRRDLRQVAALAAAVIVALQLASTHWFYFYIVWFAPLALVAMLGAYRSSPDRSASRERLPEPERELVPA